MQAKLLQPYLTLFDLVDCSPPGSSVHGILQARIPEWIAMPSFRGSPQLRDQTSIFCVSCTGRRILSRPESTMNQFNIIKIYTIFT